MYGKEKGNKRLRVWELRSGIRKNEEFLQISAYAYFSGWLDGGLPYSFTLMLTLWWMQKISA